MGETSLERKCRWWFGLSLVVLLTLSFFWYGRQTEQLVDNHIKSIGEEFVRAGWQKLHLEALAKMDRPVAGLRVGVKNGGCAGMEYTMEYAETVNPTDEVVEDKGVKILIDPKAVLFLLGTEMDYKTDKLSAQFVFNNPNQTSACGCGESVLLTPAKLDGAEAR